MICIFSAKPHKTRKFYKFILIGGYKMHHFGDYLPLANFRNLLHIEKDRRGIEKDKLVFIGIANVAYYCWCAMKSIIKSRERELGNFKAYLENRIYYSFALGLIDDIPENEEKLLDIGDEIKFRDIDKLFKEKTEQFINDNLEIPIKFRNINLSNEEKTKKSIESNNLSHIIKISKEYPDSIGEYLHGEIAEKYPTMRWNFEWEDYVLIGMPDGITNDFIYEFKSTRNEYLKRHIKPVAFAQADLYGYFFKRNNKKVQIYILNQNIAETYEDNINKENALNLLKKFKNIDEGDNPLHPQSWKCESCEFKNECILKQNNVKYVDKQNNIEYMDLLEYLHIHKNEQDSKPANNHKILLEDFFNGR